MNDTVCWLHARPEDAKSSSCSPSPEPLPCNCKKYYRKRTIVQHQYIIIVIDKGDKIIERKYQLKYEENRDHLRTKLRAVSPRIHEAKLFTRHSSWTDIGIELAEPKEVCIYVNIVKKFLLREFLSYTLLLNMPFDHLSCLAD